MNKLVVLLLFLGIFLIPTATATNLNACGTISSSGVYDLTQNVTSTAGCFVVSANDVYIDGHGFYVNYSNTSSGYGITSTSFNNITLINMTLYQGNTSLTGIQRGLFFLRVNNSYISNVSAMSRGGANSFAFQLSSSNNNTVLYSSGNSDTSRGVRLDSALNNTLNHVSGISDSSYGLVLETRSNNNTIISSSGTSNTSYGILISGSNDTIMTLSTGTSNTLSGIILSSAIRSFITSNIGNSTSGYGIFLEQTSVNNTLISNFGNSISNSGIRFGTSSGYNNITSNTGNSSSGAGIYVNVNNNNFILNTGSSISSYGMHLVSASNNIFTSNILGSVSSYGILISSTSINNTFSLNRFTSNTILAVFMETTSYINTFVQNNIVVSPLASTAPQKNVMSMGDSISNTQFIQRTVYLLNYYGSGWTASNGGLGGENSSSALNRFNVTLDLYYPQFITIMWGTNNISTISQQTQITNVLTMAEWAKSRGITTYVLTVISPDVPYLIYLDTNLTSQAATNNTDVINIYDAVDLVSNNNVYDGFNASNFLDGVHPNDTGVLLIGDRIFLSFVRDGFVSIYSNPYISNEAIQTSSDELITIASLILSGLIIVVVILLITATMLHVSLDLSYVKILLVVLILIALITMLIRGG